MIFWYLRYKWQGFCFQDQAEEDNKTEDSSYDPEKPALVKEKAEKAEKSDKSATKADHNDKKSLVKTPSSTGRSRIRVFDLNFSWLWFVVNFFEDFYFFLIC